MSLREYVGKNLVDKYIHKKIQVVWGYYNMKERHHATLAKTIMALIS